ncbi:MAG: ATP-binding cassette domain-containing protein [Acidimicrobiia bacterium]|nr:ATP-binding cassette domain-containing protein [Acidimicrobiia bacterium]
MTGGTAIAVEGVSKRFRIYHERNQSLKSSIMRGGRGSYEEFWALDDLSFDVPEGQTFGLIGSNGSGKSTLLKCMAKILQPERGRIATRGRLSALLELGTGFHPELSGRDNIFLNGAILGLSRKEVERRVDDIVAFSDIEPRFIDMPVKNYSSGMYVRLGFSVAVHIDPDILLVDEVLAVGDEQFQRKCAQRFDELRAGGRTVVIVSHSLAAVRTMCDSVALLERGQLKAYGKAAEVVEDYVGGLEVDPGTDEGLRWGTHEVRVVALELLDEEGRSTETVNLGDRAAFRFHYEADVAVEEPVFTLAVHHLDGTLVANPNTAELAQPPEKIEGRGYLDFVIPRLLLIPGTYDLSAGVLDREMTRVYDRRHRAFRFHVGIGKPAELSGVSSLGGQFAGPLYGDPPDPRATV